MTAVDAFDFEAVCNSELAAAEVVDIAGQYEVEFDVEVTLRDGRKIDVKVLYANEIGEIDVYRLNADSDPVEPEIAHWLDPRDYERVFGRAETAYFEKKANDAEAKRDAYGDRRFHEMINSGMRNF